MDGIVTSVFEKIDQLGIPLHFAYIIIGVTILYICTRIVQASIGHLIAICIIYIVITQLHHFNQTDTVSFNQEMDYKLNILNSPSHFHTDTNMINLFYSFYSWRKRNANNYDLAVKAVNNILQIEEDSEQKLQRCVDNYDVAYDQYKIAMNLVHGFVYNLDGQPILLDKLKKILSRLHELLERHLRYIQANCEKIENQKPTKDVHSRFIKDAHGPKAYDGNKMSNFDYY